MTIGRWVLLLVVLGACRHDEETVRFGYVLADEARVIDERRRMVWGMDGRGGATWTRAYDAAVTEAIEVEIVAGSPGPELIFATGRFGLGNRGDVSQLILIDLSGSQVARCRPDRLVEPPVSIERNIDPFYLPRIIPRGSLKTGSCRGETVLLCGVVATEGWCLALALRYRQGRFLPIAAVWNRGTVTAMAISDDTFACAVVTHSEEEYPDPLAIVIAQVHWSGVGRAPARLQTTGVRRCWAAVFPKGSGDVPHQCVDLELHERSLVAVVASRHEERGGQFESRPMCRVVLDLDSKDAPNIVALGGSNSAQLQAFRSKTRILRE